MARYSPCIPTPYNSALLATQIVFVLLATLAAALRHFASYRADGRSWHHIDNWLIAATLVMCYGFLIECICAFAVTGINCYRSDITPEWATYMVLKFSWASFFLIVPASALSKISCLEFYKRVFISKQCHWLCNTMIFFISAWAIAAVVAQGLSNTPVSTAWSPATQFKYLNYDYKGFSLAMYSIDSALDLLVLCLPLPAVVKLHLPTARVIKMVITFGFAAFCLACSIMRLYYVDRTLSHAYQDSHEQSMIESYTLIWGSIEPLATVVALALPTFGPFIGRHSRQSRQPMYQSATSFISGLISNSNTSLRSASWSWKSPRASRTGTRGPSPTFMDKHAPQHHASIHSNPRPLTNPPDDGLINVVNEFWVDRETIRDSARADPAV